MTKMTQKSIKAKKPLKARPRGMVLVAVMICLMFVLAIALIGIGKGMNGSMNDSSRGALQLTRKRANAYQAQLLADTGLRASLQWLTVQSGAPTTLSAFRPAALDALGFWGSTVNGNYDRLSFTLSDGSVGTVDVRLLPFADNDTQTMKSYLVEAVGTYQGTKQIINAAVIQDTFAKYAFFSDNAPAKDSYWTAGSTVFNGPVQVNARNMVTGSPEYDANAGISIIWQNKSGKQLFKYPYDNSFTTSAFDTQINWYKGTTATKSAPSNSTQWSYVATNGQPAIKTGVAAVDMPTQSNMQEVAALGSPAASVPAGPSVTVPQSASATCGGIYINGDVDNMKLTASGTSKTTQGIEIYQNDGTKRIKTVITIDPTLGSTGQTKIERFVSTSMADTTFPATPVTGYPQILNGRTNGVVYTNGNIGTPGVPNSSNKNGIPQTFGSGGISGTVANNLMQTSTVAKFTNDLNIVTAANKDVNISSDIIYASKTSGSPNASTGVMGIVSRKVQIIQNLDTDVNGDGANIALDATVFAYDTFNAENPLDRPINTFTMLGGYIAKTPGLFAGIDKTTGTQWTGLTTTRNYDSRVASRPPPYFPSTGNQYKVRSYQRVGTVLP